jgi:ribulose bisphosphate carboxylase small subunit
MYAIQVSDVRGNWITLKHVSVLKDSDVLDELQRERAAKRKKNIRAVDIATGQVVLELREHKEANNVIELAQFTANS